MSNSIDSKQFGELLTNSLCKVASIDVKNLKEKVAKNSIKKMQTKSQRPIGWFKDNKAFDKYIYCIGNINSVIYQRLFKQRCREKFESMMFGPVDGHEYYLTDTMIVEIYHNVLNYES